jgi:hypothetical protein
MRVGALTETVQVTGSAPLVDVRSTVVQHNVTAEEFNQLPKARSFQSIALTAPSVNQGEGRGWDPGQRRQRRGKSVYG